MKRFMSLACLLALVVGVPAGASTFLAMSQTDLLKASETVVQGEVMQVTSFWDPTGKVILSEALVRVEETIVGKAPTVVIVRTFGGKVGGYVVEAHGFPTFKKNDRFLLFLEPETQGVTRVAGYRQGQYRITENKAGQEIAVPTYEGGVIDKQGRPVATPRAVSLAALKDSIRVEAARLGRN